MNIPFLFSPLKGSYHPLDLGLFMKSSPNIYVFFQKMSVLGEDAVGIAQKMTFIYNFASGPIFSKKAFSSTTAIFKLWGIKNNHDQLKFPNKSAVGYRKSHAE